MQDLKKSSEKELLELAKKYRDSDLAEIASEMKVSHKVRLAIAKRGDSAARRAKLTLTDKMFTEDDVLWMLVADKDEDVRERAFTALCERIQGAGIKDSKVREDFINLVIKVAEKTKMKDYRISTNLIEECIDSTKNTSVRGKLEALLSKLNESNLLESSYIQLARQTTSVSQLQKLTESQFESVREIAKSRSLNESFNDIKRMFSVEKVTTLRINKRDVVSKLKSLIATFSKFSEFDPVKGLLEQVLTGVDKQEARGYFLKTSNDLRWVIHEFDEASKSLLDSEQLREDLDDVINLSSMLSGSSLPKNTVYYYE